MVRTKREAAEKAAAEKKRMALQGKSMIHIQTPERPGEKGLGEMECGRGVGEV